MGPALSDQAALDIACTYNHPELTVVQLAPIQALASLDGEDTWDPAAQGLPADLTEELYQKVTHLRRSLAHELSQNTLMESDESMRPGELCVYLRAIELGGQVNSAR